MLLIDSNDLDGSLVHGRLALGGEMEKQGDENESTLDSSCELSLIVARGAEPLYLFQTNLSFINRSSQDDFRHSRNVQKSRQ
jgi:hypothetical protein